MTISAKVVADSVSEAGKRLTTLQLRYPKFIHGEFMTHRVFSRNASSSRAIPVERLIKDVIDDPVYPMHWGKNQPGMSASEECNQRIELYPGTYWGQDDYAREKVWDYAREEAIAMAQAFSDAGYHKQIVNRLLEPFCHINVVVTATEWDNFFALRRHPAAQPEMGALADAIFEAMAYSKPKPLVSGQWHLPYVQWEGWCPTSKFANLIKLSVARCARVSYLTQEGKTPTVEEDLKLYDRLVGSVPLHASPAEHQATPDALYHGGEAGSKWHQPYLHGNLVGWCQYRKILSLRSNGTYL